MDKFMDNEADTGNFASALADLFSLLNKYRISDPIAAAKVKEPTTLDIVEPADANDDKVAGEEGESSSSAEKQTAMNSIQEMEEDAFSDSDSDDSEFGSTEGIKAFTRMNLNAMLKKATQKVNLKKLFPPGGYAGLVPFQKRRVKRLEDKCTLLLHLKLPLPPVDILREKLGIRRLNDPYPDSSDTDSDEDWGPRKKKKSKMPMFRGISEEDTKLRMEFVRKYVEDIQSGKQQTQPPPPRRAVRPKVKRVITKKRVPKFEPFAKHDGSGDGSGYNTRPNTGVKYTEEYIPEDDDFVYCDECKKLHIDDCPEHPSMRMKDSLVKIGVTDRAKRSCPPGLSVDPSKVRNAGYGVWSDIEIPKNTIFGPYEGDIVKRTDIKNLVKVSEGGYSWEIYKKDKLIHYTDGSNTKTSNWLRYVNCARNEEEQNLIAFQYKSQIYYRTFKDVKSNVELFVWYGSQYASQLGIGYKPLKKNDTKVQPNKQTSITTEKFAETSDATSSVILDLTEQQLTKQNQSDKRSTVNDSTKSKKSGELQCPLCHKSFSGKVTLKVHIRHIHEKRGDYQCNVCGKKFGRFSHLKRHTLIHTGVKPFKCDVCGDRFNQVSSLKSHKRIHTGEKPFKCEVCGDRFNQTSHLRTHKRIHTGEKPFKCDVCGDRFTQAGVLKSHKRIHTGEKPFKCDVCGDRFTQAGNLREHKRVHTGEKPYKCEECNKQFACSSNLRKHMKQHHNYV